MSRRTFLNPLAGDLLLGLASSLESSCSIDTSPPSAVPSPFVSVWVCATVGVGTVPMRAVFSGTSLRWSPFHMTSFPIIVARRDSNSHGPRSIARKTRERAMMPGVRIILRQLMSEAGSTKHARPGAPACRERWTICKVQPCAGTDRRHTQPWTAKGGFPAR